LHPVGRDFKAVFPAGLLLQFLDPGVEKFDVGSTLGADQVVMVPAIVFRLILDPAVPEIKLAGQTTRGQMFQGAVHGCETHIRQLFLGFLEKLFRRNMPLEVYKNLKNQLALGGPLQFFFPQVSPEDFLFVTLYIHGSFHR
jgi:hypothetical protein